MFLGCNSFMVKVVIAGSCGLDDIESKAGKVENVLGGSAIYASLSASHFCKPGLISAYGDDFSSKYLEMLKTKGIDLTGFQEVDGPTFHWKGSYVDDINDAKTLQTDLNSLLKFKPVVPEEYKDAKFVLFGNTDPEQQLEMLKQFDSPEFVVADTMNFWIDTKKEKVLELIEKTDLVLMNNFEASLVYGTHNLLEAADKLLENKKFALIKKGEHGALLFSKNSTFSAPGYPVRTVKDPTGAGDTFAGAFLGYLSNQSEINESNLRKAIIYGSAAASLNVEDFSVNTLFNSSIEKIESRVNEFRKLVEF